MGKKHHTGRTSWVSALVVVVSLCDSFVCVLFCGPGPGEQRRGLGQTFLLSASAFHGAGHLWVL